MLEAQAFTDLKEWLDDIISYAVVNIDGKDQKHPIYRREFLKDGRMAIYIQITPEAQRSVTIKEVKLYNKNRKLWARKPENIKLEKAQEGVLYRFTIQFLEKEV